MLVSTVTAMTSGRRRAEPRGGVVRRVSRRPHHARAARRVHVDHPDAQRRGGRDGRRDGVGDVVELQIEEHAFAQRDELAGRSSGPSAVKSRLPILKPPRTPRSVVARCERFARRSAHPAQPGADPCLFLLRRVEAAGDVRQPRNVVAAQVARRGRRGASTRRTGSTKLAVPTCTAVAPAIMNSSDVVRAWRCRPCR